MRNLLPAAGLNQGNRTEALRAAEKAMANADTYADWHAAALLSDRVSGAEAWKRTLDDQLFDAVDIRERRDALRDATERRDPQGLLFTLNEGVHGNIGGMGNPALYACAKAGTKEVIPEYVQAIINALDVVAEAPEAQVSFEEKFDFFRRASRCYGRSALLLSGGGGRIYFHHGVVDALLEQGLLPNVLSGASAGAWMCAQIGTRTNAELDGYFQAKRYEFRHAHGLGQTLLRYRKLNAKGELDEDRREVIAAFVPQMTFAEAFEHTGRDINISVASADRHHRPRLLNAITSPNVTLRSACLASSSLPQYTAPELLEAKDQRGRIVPYVPKQRWIDGSLADDLPMKRLQRLYAANHFIVSQINPAGVLAASLRADRKVGKDGLLWQSSNLFLSTVRQSAKLAQRSLWPLSHAMADGLLDTMYRIADQEVTGDITIFAGVDRRTLGHTAFSFRDDTEVADLIQAGRRATWPRIEQIRNAMLVSQALDGHLAACEAEAGERRFRWPARVASR